MRSLDFATEWRTGDQSGKSIPRVEWPLLVAVCHTTDCQDNRGLWSRKDLSELRFGELASPRFELESSNQQGHGQPSCSTRELCHALHSCCLGSAARCRWRRSIASRQSPASA